MHVYPRTDGGINLQYWFFYTYNEGPLFFDHDSDWEHVTVEVDRSGQPHGVFFAQHGNNNPGVYRAWTDVRKIGEHPVVLSARGTHASYADQESLAWFEHASDCTAVDPCRDPIWRTWEGAAWSTSASAAPCSRRRTRSPTPGAGAAPARFLRSRSAPPGPLHQSGFSTDGFD